MLMAKTGRPKKEIDQKVFENLCGLQCTLQEICDFFSVSEPTLETFCKNTYGTTFLKVFEEKRAGGKVSLRRMQWRLAERNAAMAIFLGKNYLQQHDAVQVGMNVTTDDDPITKALKESGIINDGTK